ncbi:MAG: metal-dependent hydrolase [Myxococcota bacterium]
MGLPHEITVRKIKFEFPAELDAIDVVQGHPEESLFNVALSLLLPYLEPYLIRSLNAAKQETTDPGLIADIDAFNAQEGQHYRQHKIFNDLVRGRYQGLEPFEEELAQDYRRFTETKSLRFNLAYAEGFEAYTSAMALFSFEEGMVERFHPVAKDLFMWHLVEELEHRTVAFDVYDQVVGGYFYRLFVGLYAQWHMSQWILRVANYLGAAEEKRFLDQWGGVKGRRARLLPVFWLMVRRLLPKVLKTYLPWYSPSRIRIPDSVKTLWAQYSARASSS